MSSLAGASGRIPAAASILGWAGVVPFAGLTLAAALGLALPVPTGLALIGYGAVILSFMGGAQWGLTVRAPDGADRSIRGYAASVLPALLAWPCLLLPERPALILLAVGFAALLAYDLRTVRQGQAPPWYGRLRSQLTIAVTLLLLIAAASR